MGNHTRCTISCNDHSNTLIRTPHKEIWTPHTIRTRSGAGKPPQYANKHTSIDKKPARAPGNGRYSKQLQYANKHAGSDKKPARAPSTKLPAHGAMDAIAGSLIRQSTSTTYRQHICHKNHGNKNKSGHKRLAASPTTSIQRIDNQHKKSPQTNIRRESRKLKGTASTPSGRGPAQRPTSPRQALNKHSTSTRQALNKHPVIALPQNNNRLHRTGPATDSAMRQTTTG